MDREIKFRGIRLDNDKLTTRRFWHEIQRGTCEIRSKEVDRII